MPDLQVVRCQKRIKNGRREALVVGTGAQGANIFRQARSAESIAGKQKARAHVDFIILKDDLHDFMAVDAVAFQNVSDLIGKQSRSLQFFAEVVHRPDHITNFIPGLGMVYFIDNSLSQIIYNIPDLVDRTDNNLGHVY